MKKHGSRLGGMSGPLNHGSRKLGAYWLRFTRRLQRKGLVRNVDYRPRGYSYYLRGRVDLRRYRWRGSEI